ncbi:putative uncharacterized protein DDB_G0286901 [Culicoides brevitarsis]|uniref:putative uncharacterized protein DDB_G0286901 n=1 Tax=Culicoides brevitarsis TaxID=469753 RepID=UPI00307C4F63
MMTWMSYVLIAVVGFFSQETLTLRMISVRIPSYKMRGENAILECDYQLNGYNNQRHGDGSSSGFHRKTTGSPFLSSLYNSNYNNNNNDNNNEYEDSVEEEDTSDRNSNNRNYLQQQSSDNKRFFNHQQRQQQQQHERSRTKYKRYSNNYFPNGDYRATDDEQETSSSSNSNSWLNSASYSNNNSPNKYSAQPKEALYSVKWYRDNEEFYRYVPNNNPPQNSYPLDGISVDHKHSNDRRVVLRKLTLKSRGLYRCEVLAEAPNFETVSGENMLEVVYLPTRGPTIEGGEKNYDMGDLLNLTCKSGKSYPASKLHWMINNVTVTDPRIVKNYREIHHTHDLITTELSLQFVINGRYFTEGAMRVKCVATISPVLWRGNKEKFVQRKPPPLDNREAMFLVRGSATCIQHQLGKLNFHMWFSIIMLLWHRII